MEDWPEVKRFALEVATKFREIKYIGWDIGLSPRRANDYRNKQKAGYGDDSGLLWWHTGRPEDQA
jgi:hypothetical protein